MKKIISTVLMIALVLSMSMLFVACNDDSGNEGGNGGNEGTNEKTKYTVTVKDSDGVAIKGVKLDFVTSKGNVTSTTDSDGKATYTTAETIQVTIKEIPSGYEYSKLNVKQSFDANGNLNVTISKLAPFVIRVEDQNGNAIAGVKVQICDSESSCRLPRTTDAEGTATYPYEDGEFHAMISDLPEGYTEENYDGFDEVQNKPYYNFDGNTVVIVITSSAN